VQHNGTNTGDQGMTASYIPAQAQTLPVHPPIQPTHIRPTHIPDGRPPQTPSAQMQQTWSTTGTAPLAPITEDPLKILEDAQTEFQRTAIESRADGVSSSKALDALFDTFSAAGRHVTTQRIADAKLFVPQHPFFSADAKGGLLSYPDTQFLNMVMRLYDEPDAK
jgi:hypothetical protein